MPRIRHKQTLSLGWKRLHNFWNGPFETRYEYSIELINRALKEHKNPVVCWSGGKDSTVVLHLVKQIKPDIKVIYVDVGVEFPETQEFINSIATKWNLNLTITKPKEVNNFWQTTKKYGWPIFGKAVASNVERAVRTGNIRPQLSNFETLLAKNNAHISGMCSKYIRQNPSIETEKKMNVDIKFLGMRASESRARVRIWADYGDYYFVQRYFKRNDGMWKVNPISIWTEEDIWNYSNTNNIPRCKLYDMGYPRNGCWTCAMAVKYGQLKRLRQGHPNLFNQLILGTNMGSEFFRLKCIILKENGEIPPESNNLEELLKYQPDFFDTL